MPNNSSARRDKKEKKKKKAPKPLSKQGRSASSDSSSSSSAAEEAPSMRIATSSRSSLDSSLPPSLATGRAGRNPPSSREMDSSSLLLLSCSRTQKKPFSARAEQTLHQVVDSYEEQGWRTGLARAYRQQGFPLCLFYPKTGTQRCGCQD